MEHYLGIFSIFSGIDFTILYDWLPDDVVWSVDLVISFFLVLAVLSLIDRFTP